MLIFRQHFDNVNRLWQLWAYLLAVSDDFDRRMDYEHVEDTLISKRVVVSDEFWEVAQALKGGYQPLDWTTLYTGDVEDDTYPPLRKISQINRNRRDYLLLRDWSKRRPWQVSYSVNIASSNQSQEATVLYF
jgi:hypothetical protein